MNAAAKELVKQELYYQVKPELKQEVDELDAAAMVQTVLDAAATVGGTANRADEASFSDPSACTTATDGTLQSHLEKRSCARCA